MNDKITSNVVNNYNFSLSQDNDYDIAKIENNNEDNINNNSNVTNNNIENFDIAQIIDLTENIMIRDYKKKDAFKNKDASYYDRIKNIALETNILSEKDIEKSKYTTDSTEYITTISFNESTDGSYEEILEKYENDVNFCGSRHSGKNVDIHIVRGISLRNKNKDYISIHDESDGSITIECRIWYGERYNSFESITITNAQDLSIEQINDMISEIRK